MLACMAEKIRLVLVVDEEIRAALRFEAGKRSAARRDGGEVTMAEVLEDLVRSGLADSLEGVRRARAETSEDDDAPSEQSHRRSRKSKD